MTGKRQHNIPKLLLRGFSSRRNNGAHFTWYFRRESAPCEISIKDIALSKNFYGDSGLDTLDELFTKKENRYAGAISRARNNDVIFDDDIPIILEFIINIICRTKFIRTNILSATNAIIDRANNELSKAETIEHELEKGLQKQFPNVDPKEFANIREQAMRDLLPLAQMESHKLFAQLRNSNSNNISKAHNSALLEIFSQEEPAERQKRYGDLKWTVFKDDSTQFILGDIGAIEMDIKSGEFYPPIINKANDFAILLPISNRQMIIGARSNHPDLPC